MRCEAVRAGHCGEGGCRRPDVRFRGLLVVSEDAGDQRRLHAHRNLLRGDGDARTHALQAVHDDQLARLQAVTHDAQAIVDDGAELHRAVLDLVVRADGEHVAHVLVRADRAVVDQHRLVLGAAFELHAGEQAWA